MLLGRLGPRMAIAATPEGPDLLPASIELSGAEMQLANRTGREYVLREALAEVAADYDIVLIDCSPSLGVLTINALTAAFARNQAIVDEKSARAAIAETGGE